MTTHDIDDLDTVLAGIRVTQREAIAEQRRKRAIRVLRVLIAVGVVVGVVAAFALGLYLMGGI